MQFHRQFVLFGQLGLFGARGVARLVLPLRYLAGNWDRIFVFASIGEVYSVLFEVTSLVAVREGHCL